MSRSSSFPSAALVAAAALLLSGCASSSGSGPATSASATPSPSRTGPVAVLATDQPCTASVALDSATTTLGVAPHELAGMLLDSSDLPQLKAMRLNPVEVDAGGVGYLENQSYASSLSTQGCAELARAGRVTGYIRSWADPNYAFVVRTAVHLFSTPAGAAQFLEWLPAGYAKGQSFPSAYFTVGSSSSRRLDGMGDGAVVLDVMFESTMNSAYAARIAATRVGDVVVTIEADGGSPDLLALDPATLVPAAVERARSAPRTGKPLDVVTVLSAPVPQKDLGPTYSALEPNFYDGGCIDAATTVAHSSDPAIADTLARTGWLERVVGYYNSPNETAPSLRVGTGVAVYSSPVGALAGRAHSIAALKAGDAQRDPATTFEVPGVPGAVGLLVARHSEGCVCSEAMVFLTARGDVVPSVLVGDVPQADRRADAVAAAVALSHRLDTLLGPATT